MVLPIAFTIECGIVPNSEDIVQYLKNTRLFVCMFFDPRLRASPPCRRMAGYGKALWRAPSLQPNFLPWHSPTVSCLLSLHIKKVSGIFPVASTQVAEGKKSMEFSPRSKEQRSPARIASGAGSLKSPGNLKSGIGDGWGIFFCKAASKGLPRPFDAAGWRCSNPPPHQSNAGVWLGKVAE